MRRRRLEVIFWNKDSGYCSCLLGKIFINENYSDFQLDHEIGHYIQYTDYGPIGYFFKVWIKSIFNFWFNKKLNYEQYHTLQWEYEADCLGKGFSNKIYSVEGDLYIDIKDIFRGLE